MSADGAAGARRGPDQDLNALLGSRICHDLINPLGAIGNGVELLAMSGISAAPEIALISESVEHANARIKLFRIAFGASSPGALVPTAEIQDIVWALSRSGRLRFEWDIAGDLPRSRMKVACLTLLCFETSLPFGGLVRVGTDGNRWVVEGTAERRRADMELWELVFASGTQIEVGPGDVHFALLPYAAYDAGVTLANEHSEESLRVSF